MDIEEYAEKHRHYLTASFSNTELKSLLEAGRFKRIIDVGCGDGTLLHQLNSLGYFGEIEQLWGVDLSESRLKNVAQISDKITVFQADAQYLEGVPDSFFDLVISTQVIEHVQDDVQMLKSLYRIAQPEGVIYVDTILRKPYGFYFYRNSKGDFVLDPTHVREYTDTADLEDKARIANLKVMYSCLTPMRVSPINFFLRLLRIDNEQISRSFFLRTLQKIKIPIIGYKCLKLVMTKPR